MKRELFGTDGIRGTANIYPMTAEIALALGRAAGQIFRRGDHHHRVLIGKDTRLSGYMIETALTAGFTSAGMDVMVVGPMPTPAVAFLARTLRADLGVMVSASHNPFADNGIKLFGPDGFKLSDALEAEIEALMTSMDANGYAQPDAIGRATRYEDASGRYIESLKSSFPRNLSLSGIKIVVDCANGAAYHIAPDLFFELGAEVIRIGTSPNGRNINDHCGSTCPDTVRQAVIEHGANLGVALDGDADRLVLVDETGADVDGDQLLAMIASNMQDRSILRGNAVVATLMSNLGLEHYLEGRGISLHRTAVGDRYVVERMRALDLNIGGEQSGHIILSDFSTTGDGLLAALQVLAAMVGQQRRLSEIGRSFERVPQQLRNVRVDRQISLDMPQISSVLDAERSRLGRNGRLIVRPSGTEPVIRVMVEAEDRGLLNEVIDTVSDTIDRCSRIG
ncbi:MAG: phosphoglucosamine mutase [Geminicoccaceae bacterium]|nr:phosphoglucosamine mutase [Geminicoccaceae bacterium]